MYESHWGLTGRAFDMAFAPERFFEAGPFESATHHLRYAIEQAAGPVCLIGPAGCGKTFTFRSVVESLDDTYAPIVHVVYPRLSVAELLQWVADGLSGGSTASLSVAPESASLRRLEEILRRCTAAGSSPIVAIDEVHCVRPELWEAIRLLTNVFAGDNQRATLVLIGQPPLEEVLAERPELEERLTLSARLRPLSEDETAEYLAFRLAAAGSDRPDQVFTTKACEALFQASGGSPRRIDRLADLALLVGFADDLKEIGPEVIHGVRDELASPVRAAA